jgi:tetratricopeptide (TPR) repeat protein
MKQQLLVKPRSSRMSETLPEFIAIIFPVGYALIFAYYSFANFAHGFWDYGLYCGLTSLFMFWLFAPSVYQNWMRIYVVWHMPSCDYLQMERDFSRIAKILKKLRCPSAGIAQYDLATLKMYQGHYVEAVDLYTAALKDSEKSQYRNEPFFSIYECVLASIYARQDRMEESHQQFEKAFNRVKNTSEANKLYSVIPQLYRASLLAENADLERAREDIVKVLSVFETCRLPRGFRKRFLNRLKAAANLIGANVFLKGNDLEQANKFRDAYLLAYAEDSEVLTPVSVRAINRLAEGYLSRGLHESAENLLNLSYGVLRRIPNHPDGQETLSSFKRLLLDTDRKDEIEDMLLWVRPLPRELLAD